MRPIHIGIPVWGQYYHETFLRWSLPQLVTSLKELPIERGVAVSIYTDDPKTIEANPNYWALRQYANIVNLFRFKPPLANKYAVKSLVYQDHLHKCHQANSFFVKQEAGIAFLINADIIVGREFFTKAVEVFDTGKKVIQVVAPRGKRDEIGLTLDAKMPVTSRELAKIWVENMHPQLVSHFVDGHPLGDFHPSHLYWRVPSEGVVARCFHYYPIAVIADELPKFSGTIDDDLVAALGIKPDEIYFSPDSNDGLFCCELSPPGSPMVRICARGDFDAQVNFYRSYANARDLDYLAHDTLIFGPSTITADPWAQAIETSAKYVGRIFRALGREMPGG